MARETIRTYRETDLDGVVTANQAVGWGGRRALVEFYGRRADTTLLVAEVDGQVAGCGGATVFPGAPATGWVHGIVVRPEHRRAGLGKRLTEAAIERLRGRSVGTVLLLATDAGRPIYQRLGFAEGERYGSFPWPAPEDAASVEIRAMTAGDLDVVRAIERAATGEDRAGFIESFLASGWVAVRAGAIDAFHLACPWGGGPTVARDPASGRAMLDHARRLQPASSRGVGVPLANAAAVHHLVKLGIVADRHVTRMWLGAPPSWRPDMIFGVFNFGVG
jgi:GNAT superfamily N-acetyltransferase